MEVADASDHRRGRYDLVAVRRELPQEGFVLRVTLDQAIPRVVVIALSRRTVLAEVVKPDNRVARLEQLRH